MNHSGEVRNVDSKLDVFYEKAVNTLSRRNFLAGAGAVGAASALAGCNSSVPAYPFVEAEYGDVDFLNFALNLEYLEATYHLFAATGSGLAAADMGSGAGTVQGGAKVGATVALTAAQQNIMNEIAYDEQQHVRYLRTALGKSAVSMPNINLSNGFTTFITTANSLSAASSTSPLITLPFNPFASFDLWAVGGFLFEDVGVAAYNGTIPLISQAGITAGYLAALSGIMAVECYHASFFRTYLISQSIQQGTTAYVYAENANRISALRSSLGGGFETTLTISVSGTVPVTLVTAPVTASTATAQTSGTAVGYSRTTSQTLHILYDGYSPVAGSTSLAAGVASGAFFPNGMTGNINITLG